MNAILKFGSRVFLSIGLVAMTVPSYSQSEIQQEPLLTVKEVMNAIITPMTSTIWGAYQLESDAQWQEIENAALTVIAAGNLLVLGGAGADESSMAAESDWKVYNQQMIAAAKLVIVAVAQKDEEALFSAGNDALYPPCESCHQRYQKR
ncbi:MAG: hypothetical protein COA96_03755 [SAR86 cluster bacterium]|uniref:Cytochrome c domain-containing protein n=1 Tax=SAR86 cluster bacterium TaxID=2030880 RepID=A0A2A5B7L5_9GAMM|nr:MAG: hypothetical protein COA96_03755 [SAR86 cluster bacterium]